MKTVLTIAGSDCSGGAGTQADIKTITAHKMYALSAITALTAQNTLGVGSIAEVDPEFVGEQMDRICTDIFPDAVKVGMLLNAGIIDVIAEKIQYYKLKNIVLDPVMVSTSGKPLLTENAIYSLVHRLIPLSTVITPNIPETEFLTGFVINTKDDMVNAAYELARTFPGYILIKGGHLKDSSDDLLYASGNIDWFEQANIDNPNTHGTGCTLSSAIACNLAEGRDIKTSIAHAKAYITGALKANLKLGKGNGPLNHCWNL